MYKYKIVYITGKSRRGAKVQLGFLSKAAENVTIKSLPKELHNPNVIVEDFKTRDQALKDLEKYCPDSAFEFVKGRWKNI